MTYLENKVIEDLNNDLNLILNKKVTYSRTGGGASSILLIIFENDCRVNHGDGVFDSIFPFYYFVD